MNNKDDGKQRVVPMPRNKVRPPFVPMTGNPENGDYLDWYRHLREGEVVDLQERRKDL